jgi:hypothetical protein
MDFAAIMGVTPVTVVTREYMGSLIAPTGTRDYSALILRSLVAQHNRFPFHFSFVTSLAFLSSLSAINLE